MSQLSLDHTAPVSVVIPAYRAMTTLAQAVASVAAQTRLPMEVIVVDDGSNDGTAEFSRELSLHYGGAWLKVYELPQNQGAASARNAGWAAASGEFIAFLDADDCWHPKKIEYQHSYMQRHPEVALCGHAYSIAASTTDDFGSVVEELQDEVITPGRLLMFNPLVTPSVMLRANLPFRFMAGKRHTDDHLLWMEIALAGLRVVKLSAPLAIISKSLFGASGLSSQMWLMEQGELDNYRHLYQSGRIGLMRTLFLMAFSLIKYARRLAIVAIRRAKNFLGRIPPTVLK